MYLEYNLNASVLFNQKKLHIYLEHFDAKLYNI